MSRSRKSKSAAASSLSIDQALSPVSRRTFLLGLGAVGLASCGTSAGSPASYDLGGSNQLTMLNWPDYIDEPSNGSGSTIEDLRASLGIDVEYVAEYADNIDGFQLIVDNAINQSPPLYDIVVPTNWRAAEMIAGGNAEPLPIELIPNHANLDSAYMTNAWDRGSRFQMPWQAGITGIAYDPALTERELNSVQDLFDPAFAGRVGIIGEMREAVGLAMLANGDDPSRPTLSTAQAGLERLVAAVGSGQITTATYEDFADRLSSGELAAAMAWSGDTALLLGSRPDLKFLIPDEGAVQWFDTMVIPKGSRNVSAAGRFMNYVYDPVNAARITAFVGYISPVLGVQDELRSQGLSDLANDPLLFPDESNRSRLFTWGGLSLQEETDLDAEFSALIEPLFPEE